MKTFRESALSTQGQVCQTESIPVILERETLREHLRYCNWNIEWMDYFFESETEFKRDNPSCGISDVHDLCTRIGKAIQELNPDVLAILEGPASLARMELFNVTFLQGAFQCFGYALLV